MFYAVCVKQFARSGQFCGVATLKPTISGDRGYQERIAEGSEGNSKIGIWEVLSIMDGSVLHVEGTILKETIFYKLYMLILCDLLTKVGNFMTVPRTLLFE